jgi:hypothetical protein
LTFLGEVGSIFKEYKKGLTGNRHAGSPSKDGGVDGGLTNANEAILSFSKLMDSLKIFCKSQLFNSLKNGLMSDIDVLFAPNKETSFAMNFEKTMTNLITNKKTEVGLKYGAFEDNSFLKNYYGLILET